MEALVAGLSFAVAGRLVVQSAMIPSGPESWGAICLAWVLYGTGINLLRRAREGT
jgi:hypothetical protein